MLVLSRRAGESIMIGSNIEIRLLESRGGRVRLGINAPPHIPVHRQEIFQRIARRQSQRLPLPESTKVDQPTYVI
ncbi:MAG: carbon storage regulator CsrA [Planctomycetota bacterium]|nr:carbon storage regulator CsrA [Planctomycetota bacterium]